MMNASLVRKSLPALILATGFSVFWAIDFSASMSSSRVEIGQSAFAKPRSNKWGWLIEVIGVVLPPIAEGATSAAVGQLTQQPQNTLTYIGEICAASNGYRYFYGADGQWYAATRQGIVNVRVPNSYRCVTRWYRDSKGKNYYQPIK